MQLSSTRLYNGDFFSDTCRNEVRFLRAAVQFTPSRIQNRLKKGSREAIRTGPKMLLFAWGPVRDTGYFGPRCFRGVSRATPACPGVNDSFPGRLPMMTSRRTDKEKERYYAMSAMRAF